MNNKVLKTIKVLSIVFIVMALIFSFGISQDEHHLETCQDEHCSYCTIIHIAQNVIILSVAVIIAIMVGFFIKLFLSRIYKEIILLKQLSLVFQKVQLNE